MNPLKATGLIVSMMLMSLGFIAPSLPIAGGF